MYLHFEQMSIARIKVNIHVPKLAQLGSFFGKKIWKTPIIEIQYRRFMLLAMGLDVKWTKFQNKIGMKK